MPSQRAALAWLPWASSIARLRRTKWFGYRPERFFDFEERQAERLAGTWMAIAANEAEQTNDDTYDESWHKAFLGQDADSRY